MHASVNHHPGLRVSDIDRAARFYIEAFGGRYLTKPYVMEGEFTETVFNGPPGVRARVCHIGFDGGGGVELFQFLDPVAPIAPVHATAGNILHFGIKVDDVAAALERVEAAGGRRVWPEVTAWGTAEIIYVADPDENVIEVTDATLDELVSLTHEAFPESVV
jgi:catechol 2,3-dioxygenase-like lactoylglutathione lyase family enzyme